MPKVLKIYWDSCAWLGLLNGEADKKRELEIVYGHAKTGKYELWTSTLAFVEVSRLRDERDLLKPLAPEKDAVIAALFQQTFVKPIPVDVEIANWARHLFRDTPNLSKKNDAIHLASALKWNLGVMHTYDREDLLHLDGKLACKNSKLLTICYPDETTDGPLFNRTKEA